MPTLKDRITDILIEHFDCPYCKHLLRILDRGTEDAILDAVANHLLSYPDEAIIDEVRAFRIKKE